VYLEYNEYQQMGGVLDASAFTIYSRKAESLINSQASGQTGYRISKLTELPEAIKDCVFDLIECISANDGNSRIASESQSSGGVSESVTYNVKDASQVAEQLDDIIYNAFYGSGIGCLLFRGID
jgi:hypothetical protein